jgi:twitching motility protein PilT
VITSTPPFLSALLATAAERRASDLLLSEDLAPRLRVDGDVEVLDEQPITAAELDAAIAALAGADAATALAEYGSIDFGATIDQQRLRGHGFRHQRGLGLALRLIRRDVRGLAVP